MIDHPEIDLLTVARFVYTYGTDMRESGFRCWLPADDGKLIEIVTIKLNEDKTYSCLAWAIPGVWFTVDSQYPVIMTYQNTDQKNT